MNKKLKIILIIFVIISIFAAIIIINAINNKTRLSEPQTAGNTAGNLYNRGLFCEKDGYIYFSNFNDNGTLYRANLELSDFKKICNDCCWYINVDENYIYYCRMNNKKNMTIESIFKLFSNGLYRIDKDGDNSKDIDHEPVGCVFLYDNKLYYQHTEKSGQISINVADIDGGNNIKLFEDDCLVTNGYNGNVYFSGLLTDHYLRKINSENRISIMSEKNSYLPIVCNGYVYYINNEDKYKIYREYLDGTENMPIIDTRVSFFNITSDGKYLFYQKDGGKENGIEMINLDTNEITNISDGDYKWINIAGDYCFFYEFSSDVCYAYNYKTKTLNYFVPPRK